MIMEKLGVTLEQLREEGLVIVAATVVVEVLTAAPTEEESVVEAHGAGQVIAETIEEDLREGAVIPTLAGEGLVVETQGGATLTVAEVSEVVLKVLGAMIAVVETLIEALEEGTIMPTLAGGGVALEMQLGAMVPLAEVFEVAEMAKKVLGAMLVAVEIIEALEEAMVL